MIARSPTGPIQEAAFNRASTDTALTEDLGAEVYDYVPEGQPRPYVALGEAFTVPDNTHGKFGWRTTVSLEVWSEERGFKQVNEIKDRLIQLFDHQPLALVDYHTVDVRHEFDQNLRDPDPNKRRAIVRFTVRTEQED
jgi:hypothetical protein